MTNTQWLIDSHTQVGIATAYEITGLLHQEQSPYQHIAVYDSTQFGAILTLDNIIQLSTRDNFFYHEMLVHPALYKHKNPKRVAIVGGGDCGTLREVLRHDTILQAIQIELDERVTAVSAQYFPELCEKNTDHRAQLIFDDGIAWMQNTASATLDIIIIDSTDPIGPAEGLFGLAFYQQCRRVLKADGILVHQSESPLTHLPLIKQMQSAMLAAGFGQCQTLHFPHPSYPSGWWSCTLASVNQDLHYFREQAAAKQVFATQYYNSGTHHASGQLPPYLRNALG